MRVSRRLDEGLDEGLDVSQDVLDRRVVSGPKLSSPPQGDAHSHYQKYRCRIIITSKHRRLISSLNRSELCVCALTSYVLRLTSYVLRVKCIG